MGRRVPGGGPAWPIGRAGVVLGDSELPPGRVGGGWRVPASAVPAVLEAVRKAIDALLAAAPAVPGSKFGARKPSELAYANGLVHAKDEPASNGIPFEAFLRMGNVRTVSGAGNSAGSYGASKPKVSSHSFGAQFVEGTWQPEIARLRVSRVVTGIDAGRTRNPLAARNQIERADVMGI